MKVGTPESARDQGVTLIKVELLVGQVFAGRYRLERLIGRGGYGALFASHDLQLTRDVALKVLTPRSFEAESQDVERFLQEARIASRIRHPHIVEVFDVGVTADGMPFMVMELLVGESLSDALETSGKLSPSDTLRYVLPVIGAAAFAHERGVLHRDIKPDNVFLARDPRARIVPKLLDFGVAKYAGNATLTNSGTVIGTPAFMSPEQALADALTPASDVWSMGVLLFNCLTGTLPFAADAVASVLLQIVSKPAPSLRDVAPDVPPKLAFAIDRALRRNPEERYANMRELARALLHTADAEHVKVPTDPDPIGLPDFGKWREQLTLDTVVTAQNLSPPVPPVIQPATQSGTASAEAMPSVEAHARRPASVSIAIVGLIVVVLIGAFTWLSSSSSHSPVPAPMAPRAPVTAPNVPKAVAAESAPLEEEEPKGSSESRPTGVERPPVASDQEPSAANARPKAEGQREPKSKRPRNARSSASVPHKKQDENENIVLEIEKTWRRKQAAP